MMLLVTIGILLFAIGGGYYAFAGGGGVASKRIDAIAKPIHLSRTLIVIESDVRDDQQRLVARVIQSQLVLAQ